MPSRASILAFVAAAALIAVGPSFLSPYDVVLGFGFFTAAGLALAWNLVGGFAGQFALSHSAFVGIGAYTVTVLESKGIASYPLGLVAGGLICAALAALTALLFLRMRGAYFSVGTLGLALACTATFVVSPYLGATAGFVMPASVSISDRDLFWIAGSLALVTLVASWAISRSPFGLAIMAVRDDETAAVESGVNALLVKCLIMAISGGAAGLFGGVQVLQRLTVEPYSAFSLVWQVQMIMMSVVGGLGTVWGPVVGAAILYALQQALDQFAVWNALITAVVLIVIIRFAPEGIVGLVRELWARWRNRAPGAAVS